MPFHDARFSLSSAFPTGNRHEALDEHFRRRRPTVADYARCPHTVAVQPDRGVERLDFIEGLRGVAVGSVMIFHAAAWARIGGVNQQILWFGHSGVDLFFVISGFCMLWPVLHDGQVGRLAPVRFFARRFLRIAPPYLLAILVVLCTSATMWRAGGKSWWGSEPMQSVFPTSSGSFAGNIATHLTFTHGLFPSYDRSIDGAFWSLSTEWQFYLLLPGLLWLVHRFSLRVAISVTVAVPLAYLLVMRTFEPGFHDQPVPSDNILYRLVEFGAGMLAAWLVSARRSITILGTLTAALTLVAFYVDHYGPATVTPFTYAVAYGGLVQLGYQSRYVRGVFESRLLRALGRISYSAYLVHGAAYMAVAIVGTRLTLSHPARAFSELAIGIPLALIAATAMHRTVERRSVAWARAVRGVNIRPAPTSRA